jgi:aldehyde dehydrogenase (NAD+)
LEPTRLFIDGQFVEAADGRCFESRNPFDGSLIGNVARAGDADVDRAVRAAHRAFHQGPWRDSSTEQRAEILRQIAYGMGRNIARLVRCEVADAGATRKKAADDVMSTIAFLRQFADLTAGFQAERNIELPDAPASGQRLLRHLPVGVCAAIIPWNFPLKMAAWKIAPVLATGNTVVLKPSELTPLSALILAEIIAETDLPAGVVNILPGFGAEAGEALTGHPLVDKIAFTGSTATGRRVMARAAETLKRVTLECGGKSANIVLDDADAEMAIDGAIYAMFYHAGQCCEAGARLFLPAARHDQLLERLCAKVGRIALGDPARKETDMGPLISAAQRDKVLDYIATGRAERARVVCGGHAPRQEPLDQGWFVEPTVFADVQPGMRIAREEIFGPVLCVLAYEDEEQLIEMANDSDYGLAGGIWSSDTARAQALAARMRTGTVWINDYHRFDAHAPFGGFKQSGIGREFGTAGLLEYTESQCVHVGPEANKELRARFKSVVPD